MAKRRSPEPSPPRPDVRSFLQAIKEQADDDGPRLVFADWLEEHGDAHDVARAEFIRLQCRVARLAEDDPQRALLSRREQILRREHAAAWLGPLQDKQLRCTFRRGLLHLATTAQTLLSQRFARLVATEPYAWVEGLDLWGGGRTSNGIQRIASLLTGLTSLRLQSNRIGAGDLALLAGQPAFATLVHLDLCRNNPGVGGMRALAKSPHLGRLATLGLAYNALNDNAVAALVGGPGLTQLTALNLNNNSIRDASVVALAKSPCLGRLTSLKLRGDSISAEGMAALAGSDLMERLTVLDISGPAGDAVGKVTALAASPRTGNLTSLHLGVNQLRTAGLAALTASPHLRSLTHLWLDNNGLGPEDMKSLAAWPGLAKLAWLDLTWDRIGPEGLASLLASPHLRSLRGLCLRGTNPGPEGIAVLANWSGAAQLTTLDLSGNKFGEPRLAQPLWEHDRRRGRCRPGGLATPRPAQLARCGQQSADSRWGGSGTTTVRGRSTLPPALQRRYRRLTRSRRAFSRISCICSSR